MVKLNQASKKVWEIVNYYLSSNHNAIEIFFRDTFTVPFSQHHIQILTGNQIKKIITDEYSRNELEKIVRYNQRHHNHNFEAKTMRLALHILTRIYSRAKGNNLLIFDLTPTNKDSKRYVNRPINKDDIDWIKHKLLDFLEQDTEIKSQIKWLLQHKRISDNKLARKTGINASQITKYRNENLKIGNMSINNAEKLQQYYYLAVSNQLVGHDVPLTAKDIENACSESEKENQ